MHTKNGFSLIEILIILTIVGILAAIGIPTYKNYTRRSIISSSLRVVDHVSNKIKQYYEQTGTFPSTMDQIGYDSTSDTFPQTFPPSSQAEYAAPPNLVGIQFSAVPAAANSCGYYIIYGFLSDLDNTGAYTASNDASYLYYGLITVATGSGIWHTICSYVDFIYPASYGTDDVLPNCFNATTTEGSDAISAAMTELVGSCQ